MTLKAAHSKSALLYGLSTIIYHFHKWWPAAQLFLLDFFSLQQNIIIPFIIIMNTIRTALIIKNLTIVLLLCHQRYFATYCRAAYNYFFERLLFWWSYCHQVRIMCCGVSMDIEGNLNFDNVIMFGFLRYKLLTLKNF